MTSNRFNVTEIGDIRVAKRCNKKPPNHLEGGLLQNYFNTYFNNTSTHFEVTSTKDNERFVAEISFPFPFFGDKETLIHEILDNLFP